MDSSIQTCLDSSSKENQSGEYQMNSWYQLRGCDRTGIDTGELVTNPVSLDEAFSRFIHGNYWKLSFLLTNGRQIRLVKSQDGKSIEITYPDEFGKSR